ncbi:MAG: CheR family methyltransferase [Myxococcaceae bacterium]
MAATFTSAELARLQDILSAHCGLLLRDALVVEKRLQSLMGTRTVEDYLAQLHGAELDAAVEALLPHETYFFRDPTQLRVVEVLSRQRVWSAGCSTGEEAYTLAMLGAGDVLGTDLSVRAVQVARRAVYPSASFRTTSPEQRERFFDNSTVRPEFRSRVRFQRLNLQKESPGASFDLIVCRNVFIYLDSAARQRALKVFHDHLLDGGSLLLGHAESLHPAADLTGFEAVPTRDALVYRRI